MSAEFNSPKSGLISNTPEWEALKAHVATIEGTHLRVRPPAVLSACRAVC